MTPIIFLKARDRGDTGTPDMFAPLPGTHVETHTRKDGVVQKYHVSAPAPPRPLSDDAGHPILMYHGSNREFDKFDPVQSKPGFGSIGHFFADTRILAESYGKHVKTAHLHISNPYVVTNTDDWLALQTRPDFSSIKRDHDGVVLKRNGRIEVAVAFRPDQIVEPPLPDGHSKKFYVTMIRDKRTARLAGPFDRHEDALANVEPARKLANEVDPWSEFDAFGTASFTAAEHRAGTLNERLGIGQPVPAAPVVFLPKQLDNVPNLSNNNPVDTKQGNMVELKDFSFTLGHLDEKITKYIRLEERLERLNAATASDHIIKSRYAELRSDLSNSYNYAADSTVSRAYLAMNPRPDGWASDVYYDIRSPVSMKKCLRAVLPHAGKSAFADLTIAFLNEWTPVFAALDALKAKITTTIAIRDDKKAAETKARALVPRTKVSIVVHEAVMAHKPFLVADYKQWITGLHERMLNALGTDKAQWKKSPRYKGWKNTYDNLLAPVMNGTELNASALSTAATQYADAVAEGMAAKITGKAGDLQDPTIKHLDGHHFVVHGTMHGKPVSIWQNVIVNVSKLGTVFNQWPARIRYDGKAVSEAEFKTAQLAGPKPVVFPKP